MKPNKSLKSSHSCPLERAVEKINWLQINNLDDLRKASPLLFKQFIFAAIVEQCLLYSIDNPALVSNRSVIIDAINSSAEMALQTKLPELKAAYEARQKSGEKLKKGEYSEDNFVDFKRNFGIDFPESKIIKARLERYRNPKMPLRKHELYEVMREVRKKLSDRILNKSDKPMIPLLFDDYLQSELDVWAAAEAVWQIYYEDRGKRLEAANLEDMFDKVLSKMRWRYALLYASAVNDVED